MNVMRSGWNPGSLTRFEWPIILICLLLSGIGLGLIFSATAPMGEAGRALVIKQMTWLSLGLVLTAIFLFFDYHVLEQWALWFYLFIVLALVAVWAVGKVTAGSMRWLEIGYMRFQPSEFAKPAVVIVLAKYFQGRAGRKELDLKDLAVPVAISALPVTLVFIQPDLGTAGVIVLIAVSMILFAGFSRRALAWAGVTALAVIIAALFIGDRVLMEYQERRLMTFLNPEHDPLGAGYQFIQSQIAIGSGGVLGQGFLQGTQNQLMFLPTKHTDFIFSVLAEEWGFVGCMAVLALFSALFLRGLAISAKAGDDFGAMVAFGCTALLFWHFTINVAMVTGLFPVVGVPLSFMSYGGSSLLASFLAIAVIVNVSMRRLPY